jgi:signal transduction histidine kinase
LESPEKPDTAKRDLVICIGVVLGLFILAGYLDLSERWHSWSETHEDWELDELLVALGLSSVGFAWYSYGRWREARREADRRTQINRDLTKEIAARQETERYLRESERRYRELFDESPVAIWEEDWSAIKRMLDQLAQGGVKDWRGFFSSHRDQLKTAYDSARITEISLATVDLYGAADKEELASWSVTEFVIDEELDAFREIILSFLSGQMTVDIESKDTAFDKSEIFVRRRVVIPPRYRDDWSRVIYAIEDITKRAWAEEQLRQVQKMDAVGQLTGSVAHDFNNLLTVVTGSLELLEARVQRDDARKLIDEAMEAASLGANLTKQLLAFARRQPLDPKVIDLNKLVLNMSDWLRRTLGEAVQVRTVLAEDLNKTSADPNQVENAVLNLAINARDAMSDGGTLTIETANVKLDQNHTAGPDDIAPGDFVMLSVTDTGSGIAPEVRERAFEPFFTTKEAKSGTGLGLSMVYGFAKQSGGHVTLDSEMGRGTSVRLYLPQVSAGAEAAQINQVEESEAAPDTAAEFPKARGETVLVAEDNPRVRRVTVKRLTDLGYFVLEAEDGPTALEFLETGRRIDLLFTDVLMPGDMDGGELAREARRLRPGIKVLFASGYPSAAAVRKGLLDEGAKLLTKPYTKAELVHGIRSTLDA